MAADHIHRRALLNDRNVRIERLSANRVDAFRARAMPQFQVTMRRRAMFLSLVERIGGYDWRSIGLAAKALD